MWKGANPQPHFCHLYTPHEAVTSSPKSSPAECLAMNTDCIVKLKWTMSTYIDCFGEMGQKLFNDWHVATTNGRIQWCTFCCFVSRTLGASTNQTIHLFEITILARSKRIPEIKIKLISNENCEMIYIGGFWGRTTHMNSNEFSPFGVKLMTASLLIFKSLMMRFVLFTLFSKIALRKSSYSAENFL